MAQASRGAEMKGARSLIFPIAVTALWSITIGLFILGWIDEIVVLAISYFLFRRT